MNTENTTMTNDCKTCPVSTGTHKPAEAVHQQIDEPQSEALRLAAYRFTVENLQARVAELEARLEIDYRHPYDGIAARDVTIKALDDRIAELEADLEAVGAGGVQSLRGEVLVTVSGFTGSGKSAIAGEIEIMCRALGLQVEWPDGVTEKNMTHADWTTALELYNPRVRIIERNVPRNTASGADQ